MDQAAVKIRAMTESDVDAVAFIIASVKKQEYRAESEIGALVESTKKSLREDLARSRSGYFVAECESQLLGSAGITSNTELSDSICELINVFLHPEARGRGVGEILVRASLVQAKELGYAQCYLETLAQMKAAQKLYAKCGFKMLSRPLTSDTAAYLECWMLIDL